MRRQSESGSILEARAFQRERRLIVSLMVTRLCEGSRVVLKTKIRETGMIIRTAAKWPFEKSIVFGDSLVVDRGVTNFHEPIFIKPPVLVAVSAVPITRVVVVFVGESHSNLIVTVSPVLFDEAIVELAIPPESPC